MDAVNTFMNDVTLTDERAAVEAAAARIAPAWPLESFVAVNPFLGWTDLPFDAAAERLSAATGSRLTMPSGFYAKAYQDGILTDGDLAEALDARGTDTPIRTVAELVHAMRDDDARAPETTALVTDLVGAVDGRDWGRVALNAISAFCGSWFDEGQALWSMDRSGGFFAAFRREMRQDFSFGLRSGRPARQAFAALPDDPFEAIATILRELAVPAETRDLYLDRLFGSVAGWASYARRATWTGRSDTDKVMPGLLAARMAWERACARTLSSETRDRALAAFRARLHHRPTGGDPAAPILQDAYERAQRRRLFAKLDAGNAPARRARDRADMEAVFCIDVRSEVIRRALETVDGRIDTHGFAGFFGAPVGYRPLVSGEEIPLCPVLLKPAVTVHEHAAEGDAEETTAIARDRRSDRAHWAAWRRFKSGAVASFGFVESVGLAAFADLALKSFGVKLPAKSEKATTPVFEERFAGSLEQRADMAAAMVKGMSLGAHSAPVVALIGHGSTSANNPHAAGLQCGACGGRHGAVNARVAADLLNDPEVRAALPERGADLPDDTVFVGGLHDTTTDDVTLYPSSAGAKPAQADLDRLKDALAAAGSLVRAERGARLGVASDADIDAAVRRRAHDWSETRPEWGLAGCKAFIASPRRSGLDLGGETFLHSYDWRRDEGFAVLEVILTAPVVVASWIGLQYFGATVDNAHFGGGDKTLHNVVGGVGVLEGRSGDLRVGLPMQSIHDGEVFVHDPVRLNVLIEAPIDAIDRVLNAHPGVRDLFDHGWLHLYALDDQGRPALRYAGVGDWRSAQGARDVSQAA